MNAEQAIAEFEHCGNQMSPQLRTTIEIPEVRLGIYKLLLGKVLGPFRPLILALFEQEMRLRTELWEGTAEDEGNFYEGIYQCAFMLSQIGNPNDIFLLWEAKHLNMDVGSSLGAEYFVGAGVQESLSFLEIASHPEADEIATYVKEWFQQPEALDWQQAWEEERRSNIKEA